MTTRTTTDELARQLDAALAPLTDEDRRVARTLVRLLAEGDPVEPARLAAALGGSSREAAEAIAALPFVYRDEAERVVGFWGLSVAEMPHRLRADGRDLYAWCAWDTLFHPELIGRPAEVESACPTTGEPISLRVGPEGPTHVSPPGAVLSFLLPGSAFGGHTIGSFCAFHPLLRVAGGGGRVEQGTPWDVRDLDRGGLRHRPAHECRAVRRRPQRVMYLNG